MTLPPATVSELSDWVNPVVVKEFRQAVQSRWVVAVLVLFLLVNSLIGFGFVLCYCLTVAGLRARFFPNVPTRYLSGFALLVGAATTVVPCLAVFFLNGNWWLGAPWALLASPVVIVAGSEPVRGLALVVLLGWFALSAVGAAPWFLGQWRRFTPCDSNHISALENGGIP